MSWDPYLDLDHGVLRNALGITDRAELAQAEAQLTALRLIELRDTPLQGHYDLAHLQAFHHHIFQDVYGWAGQLRTVSIALATRRILRGLGRGAFIDGLAELLNDINAVHPFREGNGRAQRAFLAQLTTDAGYTLLWAPMSSEENVSASRAGLDGDIKPLREMLDRLVLH